MTTTYAPGAWPVLDLKLARMMHDAPLFTRAGLILAAGLLPLALAAQLDTRLIDGASVWMKPGKFAASLSVYLLTIAWMARFATDQFNQHRATRAFAGIVVFCIAGETAWIGGAAMWGTRSHFNVSTPMMEALYAVMGLFAVTLTTAALVWGLAIWRQGGAWAATLGASLVATFVATVIVAGYMSQNGGHFVGVPQTGAALPILGWSREVGDLRVAHFIATHIMHIAPLAALALAWAGLTVTRAVGLSLGLLTSALAIATFVQALQGLPLWSL